MTDNPYDAIRAAVADAEREHNQARASDATAVRVSEWHAQWYLDMTNAAITLLVEHGVFAEDADAEMTVETRANRIREERRTTPQYGAGEVT